MNRVTRFQTSDGLLHETFAQAERHAEERYGLAATKLAHKLLQVNKYKEAIEWIEANTAAFIALKALSDDRILPPMDEEEE